MIPNTGSHTHNQVSDLGYATTVYRTQRYLVLSQAQIHFFS